MPRVRVCCFGISIDGFGAGPDQSLDNPLGRGGMGLHEWLFPTRTFQNVVMGHDEGETGPDDDLAALGMRNIGAWILGRNMFSPIRGGWPDESWKGWWGDNPPYHTDVFVLTHHARQPIVMEGGTVFHFVTAGIHDALDRARASAGGRDVRIGGGVTTVRQYLRCGLIDEVHLAISPTVLGAGEHLLRDIDLKACGLDHVEYRPTAKAAHYLLTKAGDRTGA